jgi:hypothetical protein
VGVVSGQLKTRTMHVDAWRGRFSDAGSIPATSTILDTMK